MLQMPTDFTDFPAYLAKLTIWHNQQNQATENQKALDQYKLDSAAWIAAATNARNNGQPLPPKPPLPIHKQYEDNGSIITTLFTTVEPELPPQSKDPGGVIASKTGIPTDRLDLALVLLGKICTKLGIS